MFDTPQKTITNGHKTASTTISQLVAPVTIGSAKTVTGAVTNGGITRITAALHGFSTGDLVAMASVGGVTGSTGIFAITVIDANTFDLIGSTFGGTYTSGGTATKVQARTERAVNGVTVYNAGSAAAYFGNPDMTADTTDSTAGFIVPVGASHWFPVNDPRLLWVRTATGTADIHFYY